MKRFWAELASWALCHVDLEDVGEFRYKGSFWRIESDIDLAEIRRHRLVLLRLRPPAFFEFTDDAPDL